jgi:hypothetical protein
MLAAARLAFADMEFQEAPPTSLIVEHSNLTRYGDGGDFTSSPMSKVTRIDALRDFIWRHWSEKTRGYARLSMSGIDSTTTTYLFVEPDRAGAWRVACRQLDIGYPCRTCHRWFLRDTLYATSVQRSPPRDGKKLILKSSRGKQILEF